MSTFSEFINKAALSKSDSDGFSSFASFDLRSNRERDTTSIKEPKNHSYFNHKYSKFGCYKSGPRLFNESRQLYIPRRNECLEVSENRSRYIKQNFSHNCDIPANEILSTYKFNKFVRLLTSWELSDLNPALHENILEAAYEEPREIQKYVIPLILNDKNLQVCARTGCGKTVSYIIPIIHKISLIKYRSDYHRILKSPFAIIVVPTAELALQVSCRIFKLSKDTNVSCSRVIGTFSPCPNFTEIYHGCDIVVATLGRLDNLLKSSKLNLQLLKYFVIDECDHFIYEDSSRRLYSVIDFIKKTLARTDVQISIFMSVSSPDITEFLKENTGNNFTTIKETNQVLYNNHMTFIYNPSIIHKIYFVKKRSEKPEKLLELIRSIRSYDISLEPSLCTRIVIFTDKIRWSKQITSYICQEMPNIHCNEFNGKLSPENREKYLEDFQRTISEIQILVSTDVLSRGLDIYSLQHVINYDIPEHFEAFHHRIGRVGRINKGMAHTIFDESDPYDCIQIPYLVKLLKNVRQLSDPLEQKFLGIYQSIESRF